MPEIDTAAIRASHQRKIKPGTEYNKYFPAAEGITGILKRNGSVRDTVQLMGEIVKVTLNDTRKIAEILKGDNLHETCSNIWNFIYTYIQYELDAPGREQLRRPARLWADRKGDCDCFSLLISSTLTNLNIPHFLRVTKYSAGWQHVYVIVPTSKQGGNKENYITIDAVLDKYNYEKPFTDKFDYNMENHTFAGAPIEYLSGVEIEDDLIGIKIGDETDLLGDDSPEADVLAAQKLHLEQTRAELIKDPAKYALEVGNTKAYIQLIDHVLKNWNDPIKREAALKSATENEDELMSILQGADDDSDIVEAIDDDFIDGTEDDELLGRKTAKKAARKAAKKVAKVAKKSARVLKKTNKKTTKIAAKSSKKAAKIAAKSAKKSAKTTAKVTKKVAKAKAKVTKKVEKSAGKVAKKVAKKAVKAVRQQTKALKRNPTNEEVEQITDQIVEQEVITPEMVDEYIEPTDEAQVEESAVEEEVYVDEDSATEPEYSEEEVDESEETNDENIVEDEIQADDIYDAVTDGLGSIYGDGDEEILGRIATKVNRVSMNKAKMAVRTNGDVVGKISLKRSPAKKAAKTAKKATKKVVKAKRKAEGKGLFRKIAAGATKVLKRSNPVFMLARKGMAMALALNIFGLSSRLAKSPSALKAAKDNYVKKMGGTAKRFDLAFNRGKSKKQLLGEYEDLLGNHSSEEVLGAAFLVALIPAAVPIANALLNLKKSGDKGSKAEQEALSGFALGADEEVKEDIIKKVVNMITGIFKKNEKEISSDPDATDPDITDPDDSPEATQDPSRDAGGSKIKKFPGWLIPVGLATGTLAVILIVSGGDKKQKAKS